MKRTFPRGYFFFLNNYIHAPDEEIHAISVTRVMVKRLGIHKSMFFSNYHDRYIIQISGSRSWSASLSVHDNRQMSLVLELFATILRAVFVSLGARHQADGTGLYCNGFLHSQCDHCTLPFASMHNKPKA